MPNKEWGPILWRLLHGMAECVGTPKAHLIANDEVHELILCLRDIETIMPCAMCRSHYRAWRKDHPLEAMANLRGVPLREAIRSWLFKLHENVNQRRGVASGLTLEDMPRLYGSVPIRDVWLEYTKHIQGTLDIRQVSVAALQNFGRHFTLFRKLVSR